MITDSSFGLTCHICADRVPWLYRTWRPIMCGFGPDLDGDGVGEGLSDSFLAGGFVGVCMGEHGASCPRI